MNSKEILRYVMGYFLGGSFFLLLIPGLIYSSAFISEIFFRKTIFSSDIIRIFISAALFLPGIAFMIWSNLALFIKGKGGPSEGFGVEISPKTKVLVTSGPYRFTRNPMVFGAYSIYLSLALFLNTYASVILVLVFLPGIITYLKKSEEKRLLKDFGEDYLKFKNKVSLLIPLPPKK